MLGDLLRDVSASLYEDILGDLLRDVSASLYEDILEDLLRDLLEDLLRDLLRDLLGVIDLFEDSRCGFEKLGGGRDAGSGKECWGGGRDADSGKELDGGGGGGSSSGKELGADSGKELDGGGGGGLLNVDLSTSKLWINSSINSSFSNFFSSASVNIFIILDSLRIVLTFTILGMKYENGVVVIPNLVTL